MKKLLLAMLLVLNAACSSNEEDLAIESASDSPATESGVINSSEAVEIAKNFMAGFQVTTRSYNSMEVSSVYAWRKSEICSNTTITRGTTQTEEETDTLLYIVNFGNEEGYALVSANSVSPLVVAYIERGSLRPDDEIDNPGFQLFLDNLRDGIVVPGFPPGETLWANVDPLLHTKWGQEAPYNNYCFTPNGQQAKAGCVAIATAQICAYHQYPSSYNGHTYNWNAILQNDAVSVTDTIASNSVAHLVHDIGVLVNMDYGTSGSGAYSSNVQNCWETFGYDYTWNEEFARQNIINSLLDSIPVYMKGQGFINGEWGGHAWVVDGSHIAIVHTGSSIFSDVEIYYLVHCNWGWDGRHDGYYALGEFNLKFNTFGSYEESPYAFNYQNYTYTNVHPLTP